ncbi:MAG: hypothetical protein AB8G17_19075 [Gammaproteobacteria bacterium]
MTRWIALWGAIFATLTPLSALAQELFVLNTQGEAVVLSDVPTTPLHDRPVLFVHGHNGFSTTDDDFQFRKDWVDTADAMPSFAQTLRASANAGLGLEPYFLRLKNQSRSIVEDAAEVRAALWVILSQHDVNFSVADGDAGGDGPASDVRIVLVSYGKGAISARLALKSLVEPVAGLPAPVAFKPVSEFIAIAPPNHGVMERESPVAGQRSGAQLANGVGPPSEDGCAPLDETNAQRFLARLNGHPSADSHASQVPLAAYPGEAPGSRAPGAPADEGVLYVALYASGNRDAAGGDTPPGSAANATNATVDCPGPEGQGRLLARNLAPDAINLALTGIAGRDPLSVHRNSVHSPIVICYALHTAVHGRPPDIDDCRASGNPPVIAAPRRVAVELVVDFSGSMEHAACVDCPSKAAMVANGAQLFLDLWSVFAAAGDHVGLRYVRSDVTQARCADMEAPCDAVGTNTSSLAPQRTLLPLRRYGARLRASLQSQQADGQSALGAGVGGALATLGAFDARRKRVVVLSDGEQNTGALFDPRAAPCEEFNCGIRFVEGSSSDPGLALGAPIDTIGVGGGDAAMEVLSYLSRATGGTARLTRNAKPDLPLLVIDELMDVLQGYGPQRVARRQGEIAAAVPSQSFTINAAARRLVFFSRGDSEMRIVKNGVDVTAVGRRIARPGYRLWTLRLPAVVGEQTVSAGGTWEVQPTGEPGRRFDLSALVDEPRLTFSVGVGDNRYRVADALALSAQVRVDGVMADTPMDLNVRVFRPGDSVGNLLASPTFARGDMALNQEPGATVGQQNTAYLLQDDALQAELAASVNSLPMTVTDSGEYFASSAPLTLPGLHLLEFNLSGEHPALGRFERSRLLSVHVEFAEASLDSSSIEVRRRRTSGEGPRLELGVTPRDRYGNYLGPGFAPQLSATLDGNKQLPSQDVGDGHYVFTYEGEVPRNSTLAIDVLGVPLMDGLLADVEPPPPPPERPAWQYLLALLLVLLVLVAPLWWRRARQTNL